MGLDPRLEANLELPHDTLRAYVLPQNGLDLPDVPATGNPKHSRATCQLPSASIAAMARAAPSVSSKYGSR